MLDPRFRLWDAYGLLPVLCDPARRAQPDACVVRYEVLQDIIRWGASAGAGAPAAWCRDGAMVLGSMTVEAQLRYCCYLEWLVG